ncbi:MAG: zf-HC2 domain-containing protein [Candidatus Limnocylindria bacterium]
MIDCREAVRRMWAYLDHALERGPLEEFETHLEACQRCCGELEFSRHLKEMVAATGSETLPDPLRRRFELLLEGGGRPTREGNSP